MTYTKYIVYLNVELLEPGVRPPHPALITPLEPECRRRKKYWIRHCENYGVDTDGGDFSRPWQFFWLGKAERSLTVTSSRRIPFKNTSSRSEVVACACEITNLFAVAFCVVTALHKFDINKKAQNNFQKIDCFEVTK